MAAETLYREKRLSVSAIAGKLHISKSTLYGYLRHRSVDIGPYNKPAQVRPESAAKAQAQGDIGTATVLLALRVQNNSKFVRGKKRVKEGLERYLRHQYAAKICPPASTASRFLIAQTQISTRLWRTCSTTLPSRPISAIVSPNPTPNSRLGGPDLVRSDLKSVHCSIAPQTPNGGFRLDVVTTPRLGQLPGSPNASRGSHRGSRVLQINGTEVALKGTLHETEIYVVRRETGKE